MLAETYECLLLRFYKLVVSILWIISRHSKYSIFLTIMILCVYSKYLTIEINSNSKWSCMKISHSKMQYLMLGWEHFPFAGNGKVSQWNSCSTSQCCCLWGIPSLLLLFDCVIYLWSIVLECIRFHKNVEYVWTSTLFLQILFYTCYFLFSLHTELTQNFGGL